MESVNNKMEFKIRRELSSDLAETYKLIKTAFETAKVADGDEQDYAQGLRESEKFIPELSLVAEVNGKLVGHILLTKTYVEQPDGTKFEVLLVAPLSVLIEYRNMGVGAALMKEGARLARQMGYKALFLCGDPAYYNRLGFVQSSGYGIRAKDVPDQYVLAMEIEPEALKNVLGIVICC